MDTVVVIAYRVRESGFSSAVAAPITTVQSFDMQHDSTRVETPPIPDPPSHFWSRIWGKRPATRNPAGSASPEAATARREHPDPKAWLDHIEKMQAGGSNRAAEQELKLFRDAYPTYSVPVELHPADGGGQ
jgi:hypothetical protein